MAPLNPAFLHYMDKMKTLGIQEVAPSGHGVGFIPSPVDRSYLTGKTALMMQPLSLLPSSYDLRDYGKVTPVKNQSTCGDCWAFATYGSLESNLLPAETWNLSENNLKNESGFDLGPCVGGNADMSTAYLARWDDPVYQAGPVAEADDPYDPNPPYVSPLGLPEQKHVQDVLILPARAGSLDNDNIKQAIVDYGAVWTTYYSSGSYATESCPAGTCTTYYYSGSAPADHAVAIVGWDDNFPAASFSPSAPGNGAFIIKNSWGKTWGVNGGYFYISYYDVRLGYTANYVFNDAEAVSNYARVYQYDPLGQTGALGYGTDTAWFANIFTAVASEQVAAVSFYAASADSSYAIYIYRDVNSGPTGGSLATTSTGSIAVAGYHTISLVTPVSITSGHKFSVVVELTTPGYGFPIPAEMPLSGYSSGATAGPGQSYMSSDGINWSDVTNSYANTNVCLKAFTTAGDTTPPSAPISLSATPGIWTNINSFSIDWTNPQDPSGIAGAYYKIGSYPTSDTDGTYTTAKPFTVTAAPQGGQPVYVWLEDGAGNKSYLDRSSVSLYYDGTSPVDGNLSAVPEIGQVSLSWSGFSDTGGSGLSTYEVIRTTGAYPAAQCTSGTPLYVGSGSSFIDTGLSVGSTYYYRACARDAASNVSTGAVAAVTVTGCAYLPVRYTGTSYPSYKSTIGDAYADAAAVDELDVQATDFTGDLTFDQDKDISIKGGYACDYSSRSAGADTVVNGVITISGGAVVFDGIAVK